MNKIIFITGISGSGKTTISNNFKSLGYEIIHLDELTKYYTKNRPITNPYILYYRDIILNDMNVNVSFSKDDLCIHNSFIKYISTLEGKYVIEGIQLIMPYIDIDFISNYDIYIPNISSLNSLIRRLYRGIHKDVPLYTKIYNIFKYDISLDHVYNDIMMSRFMKSIKKKNKKLETI